MVNFANGKNSNSSQLLSTGIAKSNILLSIYFTCRTFLKLSNTEGEVETAHSIAYSFSLGLSCLHLFMNLALAFDRYYITLSPLKYSSEQEKARLQMRILLITVSSSLAVGLVNGIIISITHSMLIFNWTTAISRFLTHILLFMMYMKIFRKVRDHNTVRRETEMLNEAESKRKKAQEEYMKKVFIGITVSFFIFNFPLMIAAPFHNIAIDCGTTKGGLMITAVTMSALNLIFDPLWYFLLQWCFRIKEDPGIPVNKNEGICMQNLEAQ